jgi:MoxR-like ATPase
VSSIEQAARRPSASSPEVERAVVGKREALELVLLGFLADGHVLIEDFPGLAKTLIARSFAQVVDMTFARIQFTPDLMPSDVTGSSIFNQRDGDFEFRPGRSSPTSSSRRDQPRAAEDAGALLEAMQERQVTIEGDAPLERRSSCSRRRTRSSTRARIRCPRRSSTASAALRVGYPAARTSGSARSASSAAPTRSSSSRRRPRTLLELQRALEQVHVSEPSASTWSTSSRRRATRQRRRSARARADRSRCSSSSARRRARRPRLRHAGRREGGRRAGARAPADRCARAVGAARRGRGRRARGARHGADARRRGPRRA